MHTYDQISVPNKACQSLMLGWCTRELYLNKIATTSDFQYLLGHKICLATMFLEWIIVAKHRYHTSLIFAPSIKYTLLQTCHKGEQFKTNCSIF